MRNIFCLETEWDQSIHDLKKESSVKPLLEYLKATARPDFIFRQVATRADFEYYLEHLNRTTYNRFEVIYLCFHGAKGEICFANRESYSLSEISERYPGIFEGKIVHFGACSTLKEDKETILKFKNNTGAKLVTGYRKNVDFHNSFIFELWLMIYYSRHQNIGPAKLKAKVEKEMGFYMDSLKFRIF